MTDGKAKLLLIDDEEHVRVSLRDFLEAEGYDVAVAASGEEGLSVLPAVAPDLIILDVSMPGIGGVGFLKRIVNESGVPPYPVIVLTARSQMRDFFAGLNVDAFFAKPCDGGELCQEIHQVLARRQTTKAAVRERPMVLLGEEDDRIAAPVIAILEAHGVDVVRAMSGPEVLEKAPALKPTVIVIKPIMKLMNGIAVAQLIKVMPSLTAIPIILYHNDPRFNPTHHIRTTVIGEDPERIAKAVLDAL